MNHHTSIKASLSALGATLGVVILLGTGVQAHDEHSMYFSHGEDDVQVMGSRNNRHYRVGSKEFDSNDLNPEQRARLEVIEQRLAAAEQEFELSTEGLDEWSERMEVVAERIELAADGMDDIEIEFNSEDGKISHREFDRLARAMSKRMRVFEQRIAVHQDELRAVEAEMPQINQEAMHRLEAEAEQLKVALVEIAAQI